MYRNEKREPDMEAGSLYYSEMLLFIQELLRQQQMLGNAIL